LVRKSKVDIPGAGGKLAASILSEVDCLRVANCRMVQLDDTAQCAIAGQCQRDLGFSARAAAPSGLLVSSRKPSPHEKAIFRRGRAQ
jgi:hypothetical protein